MTVPSLPYGCRDCATAGCIRGDTSRMPARCPTRTHSDLTTEVSSYLEPLRRADMATANDAPFTPEGQKRSRVEEVVYFAKQRGLTKLGVAFCVSLTKEAQQFAQLAERDGLTVELVCCRVGAVDHDEINLPKAHPERFAAICNPVAQAKLLNEKRVNLVVQMGLCIGHDLILQEECDAPVTTLVVKDRVFDHAPVKALRSPPT